MPARIDPWSLGRRYRVYYRGTKSSLTDDGSKVTSVPILQGYDYRGGCVAPFVDPFNFAATLPQSWLVPKSTRPQ